MIVVDCQQGDAEWADARRGVATASRADEIITPKTGALSASVDKYICELLAERLVPPHYWIGDDFQNSAMANGTRTEREARDYFEMQLNRDVQQVGFCLTDDRRFGCSPDGLVGDDAGLELKCPLHKQQIRYLLDGTLPAEYKPQVHFSLLVTKRTHWWFMSYAIGLPPLLVQVTPDEFTLKLAEALVKFSKRYDELAARLDSLGDPVAAVRQPQESYW